MVTKRARGYSVFAETRAKKVWNGLLRYINIIPGDQLTN